MRISDWSSDVCSSDLLEAALAAAHADISARDILIDTLRVQIARLKRMQFGKSSEKLDTQIAQLELALEELEGEAIVAAARRADPAEVDRPSPVRALPAHLPREEQRIEPEQDSCTCPDWGDYTKVTQLHGKGERIANVTRRARS